MEIKKNKQDYNFFIYFSLFWVIIGWGIFLLALAGIFNWLTISLLVAIITASSTRFILSSLTKVSFQFLIANMIALSITAVFIFFSSPTVFSGRDQGAISQAAIRLAQNGKLEFSTPVSQDFSNINSLQKDKMHNCLIDNLNDFQNTNSLKAKFYQIYCQAYSSSKAFNFPGFYYTNNGNLITQFPIAYTAWLAAFYSFLGVVGLKIANGILVYISLLTIYLIIHRLTNLSNADFKTKVLTQLSTWVIITTSFGFMWFSKFTLTENMATPLLWIGILSLIFLNSSKINNLKGKRSVFLLTFLSLGLLIFTRIEGIIFFSLAVSYLITNKNSGQYFRKNFIKIISPIIIALGIIFIWNLNVDIYFYKSILKATLQNISESSSDISKNNSLMTIFSLFKIFGLYGMLAPILFGLVGIFYIAKEKKYIQLVPLFIVLPSFFYILSPQITMEHPWMLRRFAFSILPVFIIYSIILINKFYEKKYAFIGILTVSIITFFNLPSFNYYLTFIPNKGLLKETGNISQNFSDKDLILIDQLSSGNNFEMIADPMNSIFKKNASFFFNPDDLYKIDKHKYEKIYLITPNSNVSYYRRTTLGNKMKFVKNYSLPSVTLTATKPYSFPEKNSRIIEGSIFELEK